MSVANIVMFEFKDPDSIDDFCDWYRERGAFPGNTLSLWVRTGDTSAVGINVYPDEAARQNADKLREESMTEALRDAVTGAIPVSGDVLVTYINGALVE